MDVNPAVLGIDLMAVQTVGSPTLILTAVSTEHVFKMRHGLQMEWVDASRSAAKVIQFQIFRNRSHQRLVAEPMGQERFIRPNAEATIAFIVLGSDPDPTVCQRIDPGVFEQALKYGKLRRVHSILP